MTDYQLAQNKAKALESLVCRTLYASKEILEDELECRTPYEIRLIDCKKNADYLKWPYFKYDYYLELVVMHNRSITLHLDTDISEDVEDNEIVDYVLTSIQQFIFGRQRFYEDPFDEAEEISAEWGYQDFKGNLEEHKRMKSLLKKGTPF